MQAVRFGCGAARPALVATGQALNDGPNVHEKGLARVGRLARYGMVRFVSASKGRNAEMQRCRNAEMPEEERAREFL